MKLLSFFSGIAILFLSFNVRATTTKFDLNISGANISVSEEVELKDYRTGNSSIELPFQDKAGNLYHFNLKYKKLPKNRSYPSNLDITIKDGKDMKLAYLFWANNGIESLKKIGTFGLVFNLDGKPVDVRLSFADIKQGNLTIDDLENERFVQDTLMPKHGFQMIRPVIVPKVSEFIRSISYQLDAHPYDVNYHIEDIGNGKVEFQFNLHALKDDKKQLLKRIYYHADSIETLREGMFAGKYFDDDAGTFKLVFYPALGQTSPDGK